MTGASLADDGHEQFTMRRVVFTRPFTLGKAADVYPAGVYDVETKEHLLDAAGHTAHVRTSTVLIISTHAGTLSREVSGRELDAAIARDAAAGEARALSENPDRGGAEVDQP